MNQFSDDFIQFNDKKARNEKKNLALYFAATITLYVILFFFLLFFAWYTIYVATHKFYAVKGPSMMPTLNAQIVNMEDDGTSYDGVFVNCGQKPDVFDIVVIKRDGADSIIKRVIAAEGDWVTIAKGLDENGQESLFVYRIASGQNFEEVRDEDAKLVEDEGANGYSIYGYQDWLANKGVDVTGKYEAVFFNTFLSDYVFPNGLQEEYQIRESAGGLLYVQVPKDCYFCLGDNRGHSTDSRTAGFYKKADIVGVVEIIVENHNFVSRFWEVVKFYFAKMEDFFAR